LTTASQIPSDEEVVSRLLGRPLVGDFVVVVRLENSQPVVIANDPLLRDGTPMPTRFWLVDPKLRKLVSALESEGGVKQAEMAVDAEEIRHAHERYAAQRDALLPLHWHGSRPSGGVGGTRAGVKCLHAHVAWWLSGGDDPVGAWVAERIPAVSACRIQFSGEGT
jgi:hypothetical protein